MRGRELRNTGVFVVVLLVLSVLAGWVAVWRPRDRFDQTLGSIRSAVRAANLSEVNMGRWPPPVVCVEGPWFEFPGPEQGVATDGPTSFPDAFRSGRPLLTFCGDGPAHIILSPGPDCVIDLDDVTIASGDTARAIAHQYDPTNGVTSRGDVFFWAGTEESTWHRNQHP